MKLFTICNLLGDILKAFTSEKEARDSGIHGNLFHTYYPGKHKLLAQL